MTQLAELSKEVYVLRKNIEEKDLEIADLIGVNDNLKELIEQIQN